MMIEKIKSFKDPVYGYIEIPSDWVKRVVDTEAFQRLRRIAQTSYEPLYPSATHNRFVHSLGVYHLGDIVAKVIEKESFPMIEEKRKGFTEKHIRYLEIFRLACLLHDVGHAPFSHTGEEFFITKEEMGKATKLHQKVADLCGDSTFFEEINKREKPAAPHELMSIVIALTAFGDRFKTNEEKTFFARAIAGYQYKRASVQKCNDGIDFSFLNCLIKLLNSTVVDVDRLDYLIRDAIETGFKTVTIDYQRLLEGIRIRDINGECMIVFTKRSVSVLESVVFAHDAVKKWVQNHPAIAYEMEILKEAFISVNAKFASDLPGKTIFCEEALTEQGIMLNRVCGSVKVKYLCDDDIVFLMKNFDDDNVAHSFFCRKDRYLPLWKSEVEFCALFCHNDWKEDRDRLMALFEEFWRFLRDLGISEINSDACCKLNDEFSKACAELQEAAKDENPKRQLMISVGKKAVFRNFVDMFRQFAEDTKTPFNFRILQEKPFKSGFETEKLSGIRIELGKCNEETVEFGNITRVLGGRSEDSNLPPKVYYVFAKELCEDKLEQSELFVNLVKEFIHDNSENIDEFFNRQAVHPSQL